jgi:peptidoglycan/LPS O-acetylase OafA/YrhL
VTDPAQEGKSHIDVLDGWRALSILLVLFSHWFPTPRAWQLNDVAGAAGMAIFFVLSGFLITRALLKDDRVIPFIIRRLCRIVPLAWAAMAILAVFSFPGADVVLANFLFVSNLPPARLMEGGHHLWSLCVEVQFYAMIALLAAVGGRKALLLLPIIALLVTGLRVFSHQYISIVTWHRVDEILAGAMAALIVVHFSERLHRFRLRAWHVAVLALCLFASSHPNTGWLQYLRPYCAGLMVLASVYIAPGMLKNALTSRPARYIAQISYALYVVHGMLTATWLGGNGLPKLQQYALRPLLAAVSFCLAHFSTFYYEKIWTDWGKRLTAGHRKQPVS